MSSLFFLIRKMLKNIIKAAFRKPIVLIGYIFIILFFGAAIFGTFMMPSGLVRSSSPELFRGIMVLVFTVLYYTTLKLGIDKGSSYFRLADVNLAFSAPIRPNQILLYGFIKQVGGTFLLLFIAMFQIPNLKNNFMMLPHGIPMLMLAVASYALSYPLISMVIYSFASVTKERKKLVKRIFDMAAAIVALLFVYDLSQTRNLVTSLINVFDSPVAQYIPIVGWTGAIASSAVSGFTTPFIIGAVGMVAIFAGLSVLLYKMNLDYYEDVLEATEFAESALKAKREGKKMQFNQKIRKNVKQKLSGSGASAIFAKDLLEYRKTSMFLFIDRLSITVILSAIMFKLIMPSEMQTFSLLMILAFSVYMLMLMQMQGKWSNEVEKPYIFLIPASSFEKLFFATLAEHAKNLFDGTILFVLSGIFFGSSIPVVIVCILSYTAFGAVFTYTDVLNRRIFGGIHSKGLLVFVKMIFSLILIVPGVVAAIFAGIATESEFFIICAFGAWGLVLAITLFVFSSSIFNNIEAAA